LLRTGNRSFAARFTPIELRAISAAAGRPPKAFVPGSPSVGCRPFAVRRLKSKKCRRARRRGYCRGVDVNVPLPPAEFAATAPACPQRLA
jgi:hypothetical protein